MPLVGFVCRSPFAALAGLAVGAGLVEVCVSVVVGRHRLLFGETEWQSILHFNFYLGKCVTIIYNMFII